MSVCGNMHSMGLGIVFLLMVLVGLVGCQTSSGIFVKESICYVQERIDYGCMREVTPSDGVGKFLCVAECLHDDSCLGVSLEKDTGKCFLHEMCSVVGHACDTPDPNHLYYSSYCVHGHWNHETGSCQCLFGTFGDRCDKAQPNCNKFLQQGHSAGFYTFIIDPEQDGSLYKLKCNLVSTYTGIFIARNAGGMSFNRTWNEYVHGFYLADFKHFWIGLRTWSALSSEAGCTEVHIMLKFVGGSAVYRVYEDLVVGNEDNNFRFTYRTSRKSKNGALPGAWTAGDCLDIPLDNPFSTWDKNNGIDTTENCPSRAGSGWWYPSDCENQCNLLGWGLEDWDNYPSEQRFSMLGVDMTDAASKIDKFDMFMRCA